MAKLNFVSGLANGEFATLVNNLKKLGAQSKSSFRRPVWTSGLQLKLTRFDFVFDEDEMRKFVADNSALSDDELLEKAANKLRCYPVLCTQILDATTNSWTFRSLTSSETSTRHLVRSTFLRRMLSVAVLPMRIPSTPFLTQPTVRPLSLSVRRPSLATTSVTLATKSCLSLTLSSSHYQSILEP